MVAVKNSPTIFARLSKILKPSVVFELSLATPRRMDDAEPIRVVVQPIGDPDRSVYLIGEVDGERLLNIFFAPDIVDEVFDLKIAYRNLRSMYFYFLNRGVVGQIIMRVMFPVFPDHQYPFVSLRGTFAYPVVVGNQYPQLVQIAADFDLPAEFRRQRGDILDIGFPTGLFVFRLHVERSLPAQFVVFDQQTVVLRIITLRVPVTDAKTVKTI